MTAIFLTSPAFLVTFYLLGINLLAYVAFYSDKKRAQQQKQRISESTLLLLALLGGTIGAITAQHQFRHKTRKQPFKFQLYSIAVLQVIALILLALPAQRIALINWIETQSSSLQ